MSKHTNKVHGKLNFLIAAIVVAIGAVSYLLVQTGTIDPSMGASSGIKGVKKAEKDINKNEVVVELDGEEIQEILNNPDFLKLVNSGEFSKLATDPDFVKILDNGDGIGIMGDIYRNLEEDYVDIKKINRGDDKIQANISSDVNRRGVSTGAGGLSNDGRSVGQIGNPANNDSGIAGEGGASLVLAVNTISNKVSEFQKFMKGAEFQKFMKDATLQKFMKGSDLEKFAKASDFEKFAKSSAFQKFAKNQDFQKFMMRGDFQKFMKSSAYAKFAKGQTFEKFMKGAEFQKFMKGAKFEKNVR